eukprot:11534-Heterococcus_DN1.PRE.1
MTALLYSPYGRNEHAVQLMESKRKMHDSESTLITAEPLQPPSTLFDVISVLLDDAYVQLTCSSEESPAKPQWHMQRQCRQHKQHCSIQHHKARHPTGSTAPCSTHCCAQPLL